MQLVYEHNCCDCSRCCRYTRSAFEWKIKFYRNIFPTSRLCKSSYDLALTFNLNTNAFHFFCFFSPIRFFFVLSFSIWTIRSLFFGMPFTRCQTQRNFVFRLNAWDSENNGHFKGLYSINVTCSVCWSLFWWFEFLILNDFQMKKKKTNMQTDLDGLTQSN